METGGNRGTWGKPADTARNSNPSKGSKPEDRSCWVVTLPPVLPYCPYTIRIIWNGTAVISTCFPQLKPFATFYTTWLCVGAQIYTQETALDGYKVIRGLKDIYVCAFRTLSIFPLMGIYWLFFFIAWIHSRPWFVLLGSGLQISWSVFGISGSLFGMENQEVSCQSEQPKTLLTFFPSTQLGHLSIPTH